MANVGKKMVESLVPYFTCHAAAFEGDVEKTCFSHFFATTSETIQIATLGNPQKMKHKKQNMNIIKHIVQNIKSVNHKKVAKFGSLTFFGKNLEQTPKMR